MRFPCLYNQNRDILIVGQLEDSFDHGMHKRAPGISLYVARRSLSYALITPHLSWKQRQTSWCSTNVAACNEFLRSSVTSLETLTKHAKIVTIDGGKNINGRSLVTSVNNDTFHHRYHPEATRPSYTHVVQ